VQAASFGFDFRLRMAIIRPERDVGLVFIPELGYMYGAPAGDRREPLDWVGSSKRDFLAFPEPVKDDMGNALGLAQFGGKHPRAKPWKGQGSGHLRGGR
jgi:hypothetical protein